MSGSRKNATGTRGRPFEPGNAGRPKGARNRATLAVEALLDGEAEALTRRAIEAAMNGEVGALRICLDRIAPPRRDRLVNFQAPPLNSPADLPKALAGLLDAVRSGQLSPAEALTISSVFDRWRTAIELSELERRISKLEGDRS
jgi:hypothetical protein